MNGGCRDNLKVSNCRALSTLKDEKSPQKVQQTRYDVLVLPILFWTRMGRVEKRGDEAFAGDGERRDTTRRTEQREQERRQRSQATQRRPGPIQITGVGERVTARKYRYWKCGRFDSSQAAELLVVYGRGGVALGGRRLGRAPFAKSINAEVLGVRRKARGSSTEVK
ncbi:hypothetical protein B0H10DRAFT_1960916 [Mycena sp. CBHHK59/15]|nr:hypothetical protein B0H10DRAFT_1960916 [Mycena sp. CBHHK59/15]